MPTPGERTVPSPAPPAALRPAEPAYLADAGFAHMRAGDLAAARERLEHARTLDADDPITRAYLEELARVEREQSASTPS
jgi:Flp pilus assembly protein TadD